MARKGWSQLSPGYRARLTRGGVTQAAYDAGQSLSKARGHEHTPEHASHTVDKAKYPIYFAKRKELIRRLQAKKWDFFHERPRWDAELSMKNIMAKAVSNTLLQWAVDEASEDDLIDAIREDDETYRFVGYH